MLTQSSGLLSNVAEENFDSKSLKSEDETELPVGSQFGGKSPRGMAPIRGKGGLPPLEGAGLLPPPPMSNGGGLSNSKLSSLFQCVYYSTIYILVIVMVRSIMSLLLTNSVETCFHFYLEIRRFKKVFQN